MPSLREVQQVLAEAVVAGHSRSPAAGTAAGTAAGPAAAIAAGIAAGIADDAPGAAARLAIYANHYRLTLIDALAATFPVVGRLVGDACFRTTARRFVQAHPPQDPCLFAYGDGFAASLAGLEELASLPFVADVARLEWAIHAAANAPESDAPKCGPDRPLRLHPACRLVTSAYPVDRIWMAHQPACRDAGVVDITTGAVRLLVHRRGEDVGWVSLPPAEAVLVAGLHAHGCLDQAIAAAIATEAPFDPRPVLAALIDGGLLFVSSPDAAPGES